MGTTYGWLVVEYNDSENEKFNELCRQLKFLPKQSICIIRHQRTAMSSKVGTAVCPFKAWFRRQPPYRGFGILWKL